MVLNEIAFRTGLLETDNFNMFYFSPHQDPHLPLYSDVQRLVGPANPLSIIIYVVGFTVAAGLVLLIAALLVFGSYGAGYDPQEFVYFQF